MIDSGRDPGSDPSAFRATVCPYRFTERPAQMITFFELMGLRVAIRRHDYAVLQGRGGRVAVHPVATSSLGRELTSLSFDVPDVVAATERLAAAGLEATWWDEAWGRQARVAGPTGLVSINAEMDDLYGYQAADSADTADSADEPVAGSEVSAPDVVAVVFGTDLDALTAFFTTLGFAPGAGAAPGWRPLRSGVDRGVIGLHAVERDELDEDGYLRAELSFETGEPLDRLAERLRTAGHPVEECTAASVPPTEILAVTDPDGRRIEIHPAKTDPAQA